MAKYRPIKIKRRPKVERQQRVAQAKAAISGKITQCLQGAQK